MTRNQPDLTDARLALCLTRIGALNAVVEGVAQKMHDRIADLVDNGTVKLCLLALDGEVDLLAQFLRYVAHHARETVEHGTDRNHANLHDDVLQIARHAIHLFEGLHEITHAMRLPDLFKAHLVDNQLAHEVHECIEFLDVDADALTLVLLLRSCRLCAFLLCRSCRLLWRSSSCGRSGSRRSRLSRLGECIGVELLHTNVLDLRDGVNGIRYRLSVTRRCDYDIEAALKFLLLEILSRGNALDNIADLIQCMHDHDGTRRLEHTALHQRNLDMEDVHPGVLRLFHDIEVDVVDAEIAPRSARCVARCGSSGGSSGSRSCCRRRCPLGDGAELSNKVGDIDDILRLTVADAVYHLLQ